MLKLTLITVGNKMPLWVDKAVAEYSKRLQEFVSFNLIEIPLTSRSKTSDFKRILDQETSKIRVAIPNGSRLIALDISGSSFSSEELAVKIEKLQQISSHWCFVIGGPEGLCPNLVDQCDERWSLSNLTLPHPIARIVLLEALYRGWSIIQNHPYHK